MDSDFGNHPVDLVFKLDRSNRQLERLSVYATTNALNRLAVGPLNYSEPIDARQEQPIEERQRSAVWLRLADRFVWLTADQASTLRELIDTSLSAHRPLASSRRRVRKAAGRSR